MEIQTDSCGKQEEVQILLPTETSLDLKNTVIDFMSIVEPGGDPCKGLYLTIIQDAINDYLWFGIKNKYCEPNVNDFLEAYNYLFVTRSTDKITWFNTEINQPDDMSPIRLTDSQIKLMCFDVHFDFTKLGHRIKMPILLNLLKKKRIELVKEHFPRLLRKINASRKKYYSSKGKKYRSINLDKTLVMKGLTEPTESDLITLYFGNLDETSH